MELASPSPDEPVTQLEADVPIEPLAVQAEAVDLELALHSYERPSAVSPFGTPVVVPDWQDTHAMFLSLRKSPRLGKWIRTDLGVRTYQGLGKNSPSSENRRCVASLVIFHTHRLIESLSVKSDQGCPCTIDAFLVVDMTPLTLVTSRLASCIAVNHAWLVHLCCLPCLLLPFFLRGGGGACPFQNLKRPCAVLWILGRYCRCSNFWKMLKRSVQMIVPNLK